MKKILKTLMILILLAIIGISAYGYVYYYKTLEKEPLESKVEEIKNGPDFIKKENLPEYYLDAVVAVEDHRFYSHGAIDVLGIIRALITNAKSGELEEGGSSITQQVAKNLYFINEKNAFKRKLEEVYVSIDLQNGHSKDEILELYVNTIYFGDGYYGIREACEGYLEKNPKI